MGAVIAGKKPDKAWVSAVAQKTIQIEKEIDKLDSKNKPIKNFILPGGSVPSAYLHVIRSVCRRTERQLVALNKRKNSKERVEIARYLNRLSDYLFVLARYYNKNGRGDIVWKG